jgi:NAD(P)-dependent dehydrogenase (short-subunit alcohol dehydrogenase family)
MPQYAPQIFSESLQQKVVLITGMPLARLTLHHLLILNTGGANGIGASLVQHCLESGANVCFGDLDNIAGEGLLRRFQGITHPEEAGQPPRVLFQTIDVTNYQSVVALFDLAFNTYKRIDHVVSAAGIVEIGNWFDFGLTLESIREVSAE